MYGKNIAYSKVTLEEDDHKQGRAHSLSFYLRDKPVRGYPIWQGGRDAATPNNGTDW
jgi:hypothetical protein